MICVGSFGTSRMSQKRMFVDFSQRSSSICMAHEAPTITFFQYFLCIQPNQNDQRRMVEVGLTDQRVVVHCFKRMSTQASRYMLYPHVFLPQTHTFFEMQLPWRRRQIFCFIFRTVCPSVCLDNTLKSLGISIKDSNYSSQTDPKTSTTSNFSLSLTKDWHHIFTGRLQQFHPVFSAVPSLFTFVSPSPNYQPRPKRLTFLKVTVQAKVSRMLSSRMRVARSLP